MIHLALVGFTGYGWSLMKLIQAVAEEAGCCLVAAADKHMHLVPDRAQKFYDRGVKLYDDAYRMFNELQGRCEAIYIATGINWHAPLTIAAAKAGYHIHLEKPAAATVQEVDQMLQAVEENKRLCLVGFQAVHSNDILFIKECVTSGRLGKIQTISCRAGWPRVGEYYARNDWVGRLRVGGQWVLDGPATNALAHQITNMLLLATPKPNHLAAPTAVRAELYAAGPVEGHNTAAIEIFTNEGPRCYFLCSHCTRERYGPIIEIRAEKGTVLWTQGQGASIYYKDGTAENCQADPDSGRDAMVRNFIEAVKANDASMLRCPLAEARAMTVAVDGAHESSKAIHRIDPSYVQVAAEGKEKGRTIVFGLDDLLNAAASKCCLLSQLPDAPPWAVATKAFDLAGYKTFPQQFRCN